MQTWLAVVRGITRRVDDPTVWCSARKASSYTVVTVGTFGLAWIWIAALGDLATFFGLAAAGIAVALADVLENIAGWIHPVSRVHLRDQRGGALLGGREQTL